jgi:hypothetical protein
MSKLRRLQAAQIRPERARRTIGQMVRAVRLANAKQEHLFFASRKERFQWEHNRLR